MSAADEDTELRDLLVQTLEGSGVLNKIKAELRAAVFLALEEQEKVENKAPLVNESLKKFLNTKDGRLVCSLVAEFLQFFHLDFTLAVFQPETSTLNSTQNRQHLARDLGIIEVEGASSNPLLMELLKLCRQKGKDINGEGDPSASISMDLSSKQVMEAKKKFELYDQDKSGEITKDELRTLFMDLFPHFHRNMLERYVNDEFKATDKDFNNGIDFQEFIGMYKRLFLQCRSVVAQDIPDIAPAPWRFPEGKANSTQSKITEIPSKSSLKLSEPTSKSSNHSSVGEAKQMSNLNNNLQQASEKSDLGLDEEDNEGDSFFDDPIPEPDKDYGWRKDSSKKTGGFTDLSDAPILKSGQNSLSGASLVKETDKLHRNVSPRDLKTVPGKIGSFEFGNGEEEDYMDDFNSTSHRSDKSEFSIGEEIEEDFSAEDFNASDHLDDLTQDHTLSHASVHADYLEDVG